MLPGRDVRLTKCLVTAERELRSSECAKTLIVRTSSSCLLCEGVLVSSVAGSAELADADRLLCSMNRLLAGGNQLSLESLCAEYRI